MPECFEIEISYKYPGVTAVAKPRIPENFHIPIELRVDALTIPDAITRVLELVSATRGYRPVTLANYFKFEVTV